MADNSTTETGADQHSSGSQDEPQLDNQQQSADEQQGTDSGDSQSQGSDNQDSDGHRQDTTHDESSDDDEGLARFAKGQGFDPDNLTDGEKKALRIAKKQVDEFHKKQQQKADEARNAIEEVHTSDDGDELDSEQRLTNQIAQIQATQRLQDFYSANPDARDYDAEMGQILVEEAKTYGKEAARALARNMPRLLREAKANRGNNDAEAAREAGKREERARLRKEQEGSGEAPSASSRTSGKGKLTREAVNAMSDTEYASRRDEIDAAIARGDLY